MATPDHTSKSQKYMTPHVEIVENLLKFIGISCFSTDVCCSKTNIPAEKHYIDGIIDGLAAVWEGICFLNPPWDKTKQWLIKAFSENCEVWAVIPGNRLNTVFFEQLLNGNDNWFLVALKGKFHFFNPDASAEVNKKNKENGGLNTPVFILYIGKNADEYAKRWKQEQPILGTVLRGV